jgi:hypothetical protein
MEADMQLSTVICPKTSEEVDLFFADVIGGRRGDRSGDREETLVSTPALTPADVVILDQNIDLKGTENGTIYGTDLALKLRTSGFKGLIVLRSGNSSVQDIQEYTASGAGRLSWEGWKPSRIGCSNSCCLCAEIPRAELVLS